MKKEENGRLPKRFYLSVLGVILSAFALLFSQGSFASEEGKSLNGLTEQSGRVLPLGSKAEASHFPVVAPPTSPSQRTGQQSPVFNQPPQPTAESAPVSEFVQSVREVAKPFHKQAVESKLMQAIFTGSIEQNEYAYFQYAILEIYNLLEKPVPHAALPGMGAFIQEAKRDISQEVVLEFLDADYLPLLQVDKNLQSYRERVESLENDDVLLMAHIFVLYGGDLAASTILHPKLDEANIPERLSRRYSFLEESTRIRLQGQMRGLLDQINVIYPDRVEEFKQEVLEGYKLNMALFDTVYPLPPMHEELEH